MHLRSRRWLRNTHPRSSWVLATVIRSRTLPEGEGAAAPGEGPPLHSHANEDEFMYVLEGQLRFRLDETDHAGPTGSFVFIPRGVPHTWQNAGDGHARVLFVFTPASPGMERFFERSAELPEDTRMADAFKTLASDAGMEVLGPPLARADTGL